MLSCLVPAPQQGGENNTVLSCLHCNGARRSNPSALFLEVILVFEAFDFMGCFGLVLVLTFLLLLSHSEPGFVCPSFLFPSCLSPCLPSSLPSQWDVAWVGTPKKTDSMSVLSQLTLEPPGTPLPSPPGPTLASPRSTAQIKQPLGFTTSQHLALCWLTQLVLWKGEGKSASSSVAGGFSPSKLLLTRPWAMVLQVSLILCSFLQIWCNIINAAAY